jgi:organic hydroperoxide reductase OsmC/OhrA
MDAMTATAPAHLTPTTSAAEDAETTFRLSLRRLDGYVQVADFHLPGVALLGLDEEAPLGRGWGPSPLQLLGTAVGACLGTTLLQWMRGKGLSVADLHTEVTGTLRRNERGQLRIEHINVRLLPLIAGDRTPRLSPELFAEFSVVAESLRQGIDLQVSIAPALCTSAAGANADPNRTLRTRGVYRRKAAVSGEH